MYPYAENRRNARVCVCRLWQERDRLVVPERLLQTHSTFGMSVMVSIVMSRLANWPDIHQYWSKDQWRILLWGALTQKLLPVMRENCDEFLIFQRRNAPFHQARETINLLQHETPAFILSDLWPPNIVDLKLLDYNIWGKIQRRVYQVHDVSSAWLKPGRVSSKASSMMQFVSGANVIVRVGPIRVKGGHFKYLA